MDTRTSTPKRSILAVDDDAALLGLIEDLLGEAGYHVETAGSVDRALELARATGFDAVLTDLQMPGRSGLELVDEIHAMDPETPVMLMTAFASVDAAVGAIRAGASDFIVKPFSSEALLVGVERALERRALEDENRRLRRAVERSASFGELVGKSPAMNEIYALIRKIASNRSNVLITGDSGTGKEVVARTIHFSGSRAARPFVPINCSAMPEGLLESELFGHVRGAFTGAHATKKGLFEEAQGGTLFLDEIGDMPALLQGKLLRVLQDREIRPVGGNHAVKVDVRIVAATNQDLEARLEAGEFRRDLFYRLNVIPIHVPPLRERPEDIPVLAEAFLRRHATDERARLSEHAIRKLMQAPWTGNARELENCIERALALAESDVIHARDVLISSDVTSSPESLRDGLLRLALEQRMTTRELTDAYIEVVLGAMNGRKSEAARVLGMNRRTLYRREERRESEASAYA